MAKVRPKAGSTLSNDDAIEMLMCGGDQDWTEAEVEALRANLCGDPNGRKMLEPFEREWEAWKKEQTERRTSPCTTK